MRVLAEACHAFDLRTCWPAAEPLLALLGSGRYAIVATRFAEVPFEDACAAAFSDTRTSDVRPPFGTGLVGLVAYDGGARSRAFAVRQSLVWDRATRRVWLAGEGALPAHAEHLLHVCRERPPEPAVAPDLRLRASAADARYLAQAREVLEDIRAGRYYQLNLLRYFSVAGPAPERSWLLARIASHGGPFAALIDLPDLRLASFSPERFVAAAAGVIETFPVKGTARRHADPARDRAAADALRASAKDRAELAMIVDLMRNDLAAVAVPGSVAVTAPLRLDTHANVHHLSAVVRARLVPGATVGQVLDAVCPGGSITGAPKREVMSAIAALEGRSRGLFMGNLFYLSDEGVFDSSILIRTLIAGGDGRFELAAGSGLVIGSDPGAELAEIAAKAAIVGACAEPA